MSRISRHPKSIVLCPKVSRRTKLHNLFLCSFLFCTLLKVFLDYTTEWTEYQVHENWWETKLLIPGDSCTVVYIHVETYWWAFWWQLALYWYPSDIRNCRNERVVARHCCAKKSKHRDPRSSPCKRSTEMCRCWQRTCARYPTCGCSRLSRNCDSRTKVSQTLGASLWLETPLCLPIPLLDRVCSNHPLQNRDCIKD